MSAYWEVALNSLLAAFAPYPIPEHAAFAVLAFGNHSANAVMTIAVLAGTLGMALNYLLGRGALWLHNTIYPTEEHAHIEKLAPHFNRYAWLFLVFSWYIPMNVIGIACGFFRMPYARYFLTIILGRAVYYLWFVNSL